MAGPVWPWGKCVLGREHGGHPCSGSQGPCVFCDYHWSLIRAPSPEYHLLNVTPQSQIGVVSMGKWKLTPLYPLKSVPEGTS